MAGGNEIFFLPKQRSGKCEVGSGVLGKARPNTKRPPPQKPGANTKRQHQNLPKGLTFTRLQASPPHEMRKGRAAKPRAPFAFRGAWGDFVPPQKKSHFGGLVPPHKKNYVEMELGEDGPESPLFPFSLRRSSVRLGISSWLYSSTLREYKLS